MCSDAFLQLKRDSRRQLCQREKRTLHRPDYPVTCRCQLLCSFRSPPTGFGMLDRIPFPPRPAKPLKPYEMAQWPARPFQGGFPRGLGPTYPCPSTVHMETDSASVFCVLHRIIATTTKICTGYTIHAGLRRTLRLVPHALLRSSEMRLPELAYHR